MFHECSIQVLRDARHKTLCHEIKGQVVECKQCKQRVSTVDIANFLLAYWRETILKDECENRYDTTFPLLPERLDIAACTYSYHLGGVCYGENDPFWGNKDV